MRTERDNHKREEYARELLEVLWKEMRGVEATASGATELRQRQSKIKTPDLDVYIVNLWPTKEEPFIQQQRHKIERKNYSSPSRTVS